MGRSRDYEICSLWRGGSRAPRRDRSRRRYSRPVCVISPTLPGHVGRQEMQRLRGLDLDSLPKVSGSPRLGPCVGNVGNFIAVGLNYADHAAEGGDPIPAEPVLFHKARSSICGPERRRDPAARLDQARLGSRVGGRDRRAAELCSEDEAWNGIAGFCICHDVSERAFQLERGGTWSKGKGCPTFGPLGPWLVTPDEIDGRPEALNLAGTEWQAGSEREYGQHDLSGSLCRFLHLAVHASGTRRCHHHRHASWRWSWDAAGKILEARRSVSVSGIDGLGEQMQTIRSYSAAPERDRSFGHGAQWVRALSRFGTTSVPKDFPTFTSGMIANTCRSD